jgi:recombination protein RecA
MNGLTQRFFFISTLLCPVTSFVGTASSQHRSSLQPWNVDGSNQGNTFLHARGPSKKKKPEPEFEESTTTVSKTVGKEVDAAKKAALDGVLHRIEKTHGRGSVVKLGDADFMKIETISSGSLTLDAALGGGYPRGRVVEIFGPESSGKTTLALHAIAEAQKKGGQACFIDAEHALDPTYAERLGVNVDNLLVCQPDSGEMALDVVDQLVRSAAVDIVVIDSVAALVPRAELEGGMSDMQVGLQARLMSKAMRKITGSLAASQCCIIFLNQLRSKVGVIYGSPEVTAGGNALKFYSSVRLDTRRKEILPDNTGIRIKVKVVKNKIAAPFKAVMLDILFGSGIDRLGSMLDAAVDLDIVERRGSWFSYKGNNIAQGRQKTIDLLLEKGEFAAELEHDVRHALLELGTTSGEEIDVYDDTDNKDIAALSPSVESDIMDPSLESYLE